MLRRPATAIVLALIALACGTPASATPSPRDDAQYRPGQEWTFAAPPEMDGASLVVLRTESLGELPIVHVAVRGLRPAAEGGATEIRHLPFARSALEASGMVLVHDRVPIPAFDEGYREWQSAHGGVWTLPVAEVVATVMSSAR